MESSFWLERWDNDEIGFHQADTNPHLRKHWSRVPLTKGDTVLVPLCGKSRDMLWLLEQGYKVVGVELSEKAVRAFFEENSLTPTVVQRGPFQAWSSGDITLLQGDFFALSPEHIPNCHGVFDRASLVALPPQMRQSYAETLKRCLPAGITSLLVTYEYPSHESDGPPFSVDKAEVQRVFLGIFKIEEIERLDILDDEPRFRERGITSLHEGIYLLTS